jgi:hypothetical protein
MPTEYSKTVPFVGHTAKAVDVARTTFMSQGFQIVANSDHELRVTGPGLNSTKENPLKGVSEASIIIRASAIEIKAMLGGTEKLKKFLRIFPLGMALFFLLVIGIVFGVIALTRSEFQQWWIFLIAALIPALALSPWLFLSPIMVRWIEKKTVQAVDTLLNNMVVIGKDG